MPIKCYKTKKSQERGGPVSTPAEVAHKSDFPLLLP